MKLHEYIPLALRTESHLVGGNGSERIIHSVLGFMTEIQEYRAASSDATNAKEELGDLCWYLAPASDCLAIDWVINTPPIFVSDIGFQKDVARLADFGKRWLYYRKDPSAGEITEAQQAVIGVAGWTFREIRSRKWSVDAILDMNIAKLRNRYPEKFNTTQAIHRDLSAERRTLEDHGTIT